MKYLLILLATQFILLAEATAAEVALIDTNVIGVDASSALPPILAPHSDRAVLPSDVGLIIKDHAIGGVVAHYDDNIDKDVLVQQLSTKYGNPVTPYKTGDARFPIWRTKEAFTIELISPGKGGMVIYEKKKAQ